MDIDAADDDAQAMPQALGFSSFGAQDRPQKKRRYNPHADASGLIPQTSAPKTTTGSNSTPLGTSTRKAAPPPPAMNANEVDIDDDDDANEGHTGPAPVASDAQHGAPPLGLPQRPPTSTARAHPSSQDQTSAGDSAPVARGMKDVTILHQTKILGRAWRPP
jgi:hypothetical protein